MAKQTSRYKKKQQRKWKRLNTMRRRSAERDIDALLSSTRTAAERHGTLPPASGSDEALIARLSAIVGTDLKTCKPLDTEGNVHG